MAGLDVRRCGSVLAFVNLRGQANEVLQGL